MQTTGLMSVCARVSACKRMVSVERTMKWKHPITISLHLSIRTSSMQREHSWVASSLFTITHRSADKWGYGGGGGLCVPLCKKIQGNWKTDMCCITCCNIVCDLWAWYLPCLILNMNCLEKSGHAAQIPHKDRPRETFQLNWVDAASLWDSCLIEHSFSNAHRPFRVPTV